MKKYLITGILACAGFACASDDNTMKDGDIGTAELQSMLAAGTLSGTNNLPDRIEAQPGIQTAVFDLTLRNPTAANFTLTSLAISVEGDHNDTAFNEGDVSVRDSIDDCTLSTATGTTSIISMISTSKVVNREDVRFRGFSKVLAARGTLRVLVICEFTDKEPEDCDEEYFRFGPEYLAARPTIVRLDSVCTEPPPIDSPDGGVANADAGNADGGTTNPDGGMGGPETLKVRASVPPSSATYVKGATDVDVVGYVFEANGSDVTVTDLTFNVIGDDDGALANAADIEVHDFINSCSIYDAQDGTLIDGPVAVEISSGFGGGESPISFNNFSWTIAAGDTRKAMLRCNFANVDTNGGDNDLYSFYIDQAGDITAEDANGQNVYADLSVVDAEANDDGDVVSITITNSGSLAVTLDGSSPQSDIILGNSTNITVSTYRFQATDEDFLVKRIAIRNCVTATADANDDCAGPSEFNGDDVVVAVVILEYMNQAGNIVTKTGFLSGGMAQFSGLDFYVPSSSTRTLKVRVTTNSVSSIGANAGDMIQLNFDAEASGTAVFEAIGADSGETLTEADLDTYVVASSMVAHKTQPTITLHASSPSGASIPGFNEVLRFDVAADSRGFVTIDQIVFGVRTSESGSAFNACDTLADGDVFQLYDISDSSNKLDDDGDWAFIDNTDSTCVSGGGDMDSLAYAVLNFEGSGANPEEIDAGTTKTYVLKVDTTGASSADDDSIRVDIVDQDEADRVLGGLAAVQWHDDVEGSDFDGTYIMNLPINGGTLMY